MSSDQWHKIVFQKSDSDYIAISQSIKNQFRKLRMSAGSPVDMALFVRDEIHRTEFYYFSPACSSYAQSFLEEVSAAPCSTPDPTGLGLLEGDAKPREYILGKSSRIEIPAKRQ